jgi:hypothetical protein
MGNTGYRHQLERARRFFSRVYDLSHPDWGTSAEVEFQDMAWAFFQNCWHVKDWVRHDPKVTDAQKTAVIDMAHNSSDLMVCREMCNGIKHLNKIPGEAAHSHIDAEYADGFTVHMDCVIEDGGGKPISGKELGHRCLAEWERILTSQGLAI